MCIIYKSKKLLLIISKAFVHILSEKKKKRYRNDIIKTLNYCRQFNGVLVSLPQSKREMIGYIKSGEKHNKNEGIIGCPLT